MSYELTAQSEIWLLKNKIRQLKNNLRKKPKIFIFVEGGLIQSIISDSIIHTLVLDGDTDGLEEVKEFTDFDGDKFNARIAWQSKADIEKKTVDHYFKQAKEK